MLVAGKSLDRVLGEGDSVGDIVSHFVHLSDIERVLREALDQCVLVADGAALVFGMLLGPARYQLQFGREIDPGKGSSYASICSGVASSLQVTCVVVMLA